MVAERYVDYWGAVIATGFTLYLILNGILGKRVRSLINNRSVKSRTEAVRRLHDLIHAANNARKTNPGLQVALAYSTTLIIRGWSIYTQGLILYLFGLIVSLVGLGLRSPIPSFAVRYYAPIETAFAGIGLLSIGTGVFLILNGQLRIRRGIALRDALARRPKFLEDETKRLRRITASGGVELNLVQAVENEFLTARDSVEIDWIRTLGLERLSPDR